MPSWASARALAAMRASLPLTVLQVGRERFLGRFGEQVITETDDEIRIDVPFEWIAQLATLRRGRGSARKRRKAWMSGKKRR